MTIYIVFKISNGPPKKINKVNFLEPPTVVFNTAVGGINSFEISYPITHKIKFCVTKFNFMTIYAFKKYISNFTIWIWKKII